MAGGGRVDRAALEEVVGEGSGGGEAGAEALLLLLIMDGTGSERIWSPGSRGRIGHSGRPGHHGVGKI
jgi:hypothetical protein